MTAAPRGVYIISPLTPGIAHPVSSSRFSAAGLAGRYATALFDLAEGEGALDAVADDLKTLVAMLNESADFRRMVVSPVIDRASQGRAITAVATKAGLSALTVKFLGVLANNRRLFALGDVASSYLQILADHRGEATAEVTSAKPLSAAQLQAVTDALKTAVGSKVAVETRVDPGLLGGLIVKMGSQMVDSSLRSKLQQLRLSMKGVG